MTGMPHFGALCESQSLAEQRRYQRRVGDELWSVTLASEAGKVELSVAEFGGQVEAAKYPGLADWIEKLAGAIEGVRQTWHTRWEVDSVGLARDIEARLIADGARLVFCLASSRHRVVLRDLVGLCPEGAVARFRAQLSDLGEERRSLLFETLDQGKTFALYPEAAPPAALEDLFDLLEVDEQWRGTANRAGLARILAWVDSLDQAAVEEVWGAWDFGEEY